MYRAHHPVSTKNGPPITDLWGKSYCSVVLLPCECSLFLDNKMGIVFIILFIILIRNNRINNMADKWNNFLRSGQKTCLVQDGE